MISLFCIILMFIVISIQITILSQYYKTKDYVYALNKHITIVLLCIPIVLFQGHQHSYIGVIAWSFIGILEWMNGYKDCKIADIEKKIKIVDEDILKLLPNWYEEDLKKPFKM